MESQEKSEAASKQARAEVKRRAEEKKIAKTMKTRKDDVSQLVDSFSELGSHPSNFSSSGVGGREKEKFILRRLTRSGSALWVSSSFWVGRSLWVDCLLGWSLWAGLVAEGRSLWSVAMGWLLWVGRCGRSLWVGRYGSVAVGWSLWVGRCG